MTSVRASRRSSVVTATTPVARGYGRCCPNAVVYLMSRATGPCVCPPYDRSTHRRRRSAPRHCASVAAASTTADATRFDEVYSLRVHDYSCHPRRVSTSFLAVHAIQTAGALWEYLWFKSITVFCLIPTALHGRHNIGKSELFWLRTLRDDWSVIFAWYSSTVYVVCSSLCHFYFILFFSHCILSVCCLMANKDFMYKQWYFDPFVCESYIWIFVSSGRKQLRFPR